MEVTYPPEMRQRAKQDKKELITIALPGLTYQAPASKAEIILLHEMFRTFIQQHRKRVKTQ